VEKKGGVLYLIDRLGCDMPWSLVVPLCIVPLGLGLVDRLTSRSRNRGMTSGVSGDNMSEAHFPKYAIERDDSRRLTFTDSSF